MLELDVTTTRPTRLAHLRFKNLYLGQDGQNKRAWFKGLPNEEAFAPAPADLNKDLQILFRLCQKRGEREQDFSLTHDGVTYRVSKLITIKGFFYMLRRGLDVLPGLEALGFHPKLVRLLLDSKLLHGLVLFVGQSGAGKTTSAGTFMLERLHRFGGVAITAEDPPELNLQGEHGKGICFQTWSREDTGGYAGALRRIIRDEPSIIFLGEIRDPETAVLALEAGINGHLIISTGHALDIPSSLARLADMAARKTGTVNNALNTLASGLSFVVHQTMGDDFRLKQVDFLAVNGEDAETIRAKIKRDNLERLKDDIQKQANRLYYT